jgi:hypothetical protein
MLKYLGSFITNVDHFGRKVELSFNKERLFKSFLGGVFSLVMYCATFAFVISIGTQFVFRLNPSTTMSTQKQPSAPLIDLQEEDMIFALYILTSDYETLNDPSIATIEVYQYLFNRTYTDVNEANIPISLTNCTQYKSYFTERGFSDDFSRNGLDNGLCLKFSNKTIIGGNFILDYFSNIYISVKTCDSQTSPVACKSKAEIDKKLRGSYFELYYLDWNIDPNNFEKPFKRFFSNYFVLLDALSLRFVDLYFKNTEIMSNTGPLFDSFENQTKVVFDRFREQLDPSHQDQEILQLYINISENLSIYTRMYMKLQDYFAKIGGLFQACVIIGSIITSSLTHYEMSEYMMNCLFNFKKEEDLKKSLFKIDHDIQINKKLFKRCTTSFKRPSHGLMNLELPDIKLKQLVRSNSEVKGTKTSPLDIHLDLGEGEANSVISPPINIDKQFHRATHPLRNNKAPNEYQIMEQNMSPIKTTVDKKNKQKEKEFKNKLDIKIKEMNNSMISYFKTSHCDKVYKIMNDILGCNFKRRTIRLYDNAYKKLNGYMDFLKIIKLLKEFRQLRKIYFNSSQYKMFKNHAKPIISEHPEKLNDEDDDEVQLNYYKLYSIYVKSREKAKTDKVYKKLMKNFDTNLGTIFEKINQLEVN